MTWLLAAAIGVLGVVSMVAGLLAFLLAQSASRTFEAALADGSDEGMRARGVVLVERMRHPLLRWIINRRTGAMAGTVVVGVVRDRLAALRRGGVIGGVVGVGLLILAVALPDLMA